MTSWPDSVQYLKTKKDGVRGGKGRIVSSCRIKRTLWRPEIPFQELWGHMPSPLRGALDMTCNSHSFSDKNNFPRIASKDNLGDQPCIHFHHTTSRLDIFCTSPPLIILHLSTIVGFARKKQPPQKHRGEQIACAKDSDSFEKARADIARDAREIYPDAPKSWSE